MPIDYNAPFKSSLYGIGGVQRKTAAETIKEQRQEEINKSAEKSVLYLGSRNKWIATNTGGGGRGANVQPQSPTIIETPDVTNSPSVVQQTTRQPQPQQQQNYNQVNRELAQAQYGQKQVVVAYYPEFKDQELNRSLSGFTKSSGGRIEITKKTEWVGERFPRERTTISARSSSEDYLSSRMETAREFNLSGWTAEEILKGEKFILAPRTISYDTTGNLTPELIYKSETATKLRAQDYFFKTTIGESRIGGIGSRNVKELTWSQKLIPYATLGILGNKQFRQSVMTGVDNAIFSYFRGQKKSYEFSLNPAKLGSKDEFTGQYYFNRQKLFGDKDIKTFATYTLLSPLSQYPPVRYAFAYLGASAGVQTLKEKGIGSLGESLVYFGLGASSVPKYNLLTRTGMRLSSRYTPLEKTGITYVEGTTIPRTLSELTSLEGKRISTIHVTTARFAEKTLITAQTQGAKGFRIKNLLLGLYRSSPVSTKESMVSGYTTRPKFITNLKDFPQIFQQAYTSGVKGRDVLAYIRTSSRPAAYLSYGGIGDKGGQSLGKFIIGNKPITLIKETLTLAKSPIGKNLRETSVMQIENPATYIAPENIYKLSTEGQVYTPPAYYTKSGVLVTGKAQTGEAISGSMITTYPSQKTFTFYPERTPNIITKIGEKLYSQKNPRLLDFKESFFYKTFSSTRYFKLEILPAKTTAVRSDFKISPEELGKVDVLDLASYSRTQQSYYTGTRIVSPSNVLSTSSIFKSTSPMVESPMLLSEMRGIPSLSSSGYFLNKSIPSYNLSSTSFSFESSFVPPPEIIERYGRRDRDVVSSVVIPSVVIPPSPPVRTTTAPPSIVSRTDNIYQVGYPSDYFIFRFGKFDLKEKKKKKGEKKRKIKVGNLGVYVLPDLRSVSLTEAESYRRFGRGEAIAPRLTKDIYTSALITFKGYGTGYIPTEQMRTRKIKL